LDTREQRCEESASAIRRVGSLVVTSFPFPSLRRFFDVLDDLPSRLARRVSALFQMR
jgi:hypothetical protein